MSKKKLGAEKYREGGYLLAVLLYCYSLLQLTFYKESLLFILGFTWKAYYLFFLPGYCLLLHKRETVGFPVRLIIGGALGTALLLISSYYLGILGLHLRYHAYVLPPAFILLGLALYRYRERIEQWKWLSP